MPPVRLPIRPYAPTDRDAIHALARHPSLDGEFGWLLDNGELDTPDRHPVASVLGPWVAARAGEVVGFTMLLQFDSEREPWTLLRVAVREPYRRSGLGRSLVDRALEALTPRRRTGEPLRISHWHPAPASEAFARALGFEPERFFWTLERPGRLTPEPVWPAGLETRTFDGSDHAFQDWSDTYNLAFSRNAMTVTSTVDTCRVTAAAPHFRADGLLLAYRDDRCVGFCQCGLHPDRGEVDVVGVIPELRGVGLGRALLRWGVAWLLAQSAPAVRLFVDGENETAVRLYQTEGFGAVRTRAIWKQTTAP